MAERFKFRALEFCGFLVAVFAYQLFAGFEPGFNASSSPWWKFFTSFLGHGDLDHLMGNLFFIGLFGSIYEKMTDGRVFLLTFLAAAVIANLSAFVAFPNTTIIGASGGAFGLLAAAAAYRPNAPALALGVALPMWAGLVLYTLINLAGLTSPINTAHEAHLIGIAVGVPVGLWLRSENQDEEDEDNLEQDSWLQRIREWEEKYMLS